MVAEALSALSFSLERSGSLPSFDEFRVTIRVKEKNENPWLVGSDVTMADVTSGSGGTTREKDNTILLSTDNVGKPSYADLLKKDSIAKSGGDTGDFQRAEIVVNDEDVTISRLDELSDNHLAIAR
ncbi:hypothetical protein V6N13_010232 [Hibiscus sabdariffa]